jgi:hypothetical protein
LSLCIEASITLISELPSQSLLADLHIFSPSPNRQFGGDY